ncbi:MAG: hypothetical protein RMJ18_02755 [Candidatus Aenigmarchaeota archaeon]|nr:hypothetical protein [Candidatus Aenigmarchaeota archaeon]MDW8160311.1 hypothetical protein [Candidatus Aenigmarchaeota archaeon]
MSEYVKLLVEDFKKRYQQFLECCNNIKVESEGKGISIYNGPVKIVVKNCCERDKMLKFLYTLEVLYGGFEGSFKDFEERYKKIPNKEIIKDLDHAIQNYLEGKNLYEIYDEILINWYVKKLKEGHPIESPMYTYKDFQSIPHGILHMVREISSQLDQMLSQTKRL